MVFLVHHPSDLAQSTNLRWLQALLREKREAPAGGDGFGVVQPEVLENSPRCLAYRLAQTPDVGSTSSTSSTSSNNRAAGAVEEYLVEADEAGFDPDRVVVATDGPGICFDFVLFKGAEPPAWQEWLGPRGSVGGGAAAAGARGARGARSGSGASRRHWPFPLAGAHSLTLLLEPPASAALPKSDGEVFPVEAWEAACYDLSDRVRGSLRALWKYTRATCGLAQLGEQQLADSVRARCAMAVDVLVDAEQLWVPREQQEMVRNGWLLVYPRVCVVRAGHVLLHSLRGREALLGGKIDGKIEARDARSAG
jgi:hypothetical protein